MRLDTFTLRVFDCSIRIECLHVELRTLLQATYGHLFGVSGVVDVSYTVGRDTSTSQWYVVREDAQPLRARDLSDFILLFDDQIIIEVQKLRSDLYFIHAAVITFSGKACMLIAASGGGKSTLSWSLLHHGFGFLSDELGPVDLDTLHVYPYPRAICLKAVTTGAPSLPESTYYTSGRMHIPIRALPTPAATVPVPVAAIIFIQRDAATGDTRLEKISPAQAGVRLYANVLNSLAHPGDGLDGALHIARQCACFEFVMADLSEASHYLASEIRRLCASAE